MNELNLNVTIQGLVHPLLMARAIHSCKIAYAETTYWPLRHSNPISVTVNWSRWQSPSIESVEAPRSYEDSNYHPVYDKMDAYEGDYDALWNTD